MLELPIFYMASIQGVVTLAFVALWLEDRRELATLWWAVAFFFLSLLLLVSEHGGGLKLVPPQYSLWAYNVFSGLSAGAFITAACYFRSWRLPLELGLALAALVAGIVLLVPPLLPAQYAQHPAIAIMTIVHAVTAIAMWGPGLLAPIAAVFFSLRALNSFAYLVSPGYVAAIVNSGLAPYVLVITVLLSAALLLLSVVHRRQLTLSNHIRFLSLTRAISQALQGVDSQTQASSRIIKLLLAHQLWRNAAVFKLNEQTRRFTPLAMEGAQLTSALRELLSEGIPLDTSIIGRAYETKKLVCDYDAFGEQSVERYGDRLGIVHSKLTLVTVPLVHNDNVLGLLVVNRITAGELLEEEFRILENIGQVMGFALANIQQLEALSYNATHDALTGLRNRIALHQYFEQQANEKRFVVMLFDLNNFKEVNDTLGHSVGDAMLVSLAARLQQELESDNIRVYRLGGDEFIVTYDMSPACSPKEALAERLLALISKVIVLDDVSLRTTAAIGVVDSADVTINSHELLRCADLAMYQAKIQGVPIAYYEKSTDYDVQRRADILAGIATAIDSGQLALAYQPIVHLATRQCTKCEALVRWHHPSRGLIEASEFMPIVETTQMVMKLARVVINTAIADVKTWQQAGLDMTVALNLSARNLLDEGLVDYLVAQAAEQGVAPNRIQLEITETMLMTDRRASEAVLQHLVDAGFSIALDDFGTGYSSLSYLPRFPVDTLKIDASFTHDMLHDSGTLSVVESTVELGRKLGLIIVAEGVENIAQAQAYQQMGCDYLQGYFYAKPMPKLAFSRWLSDYS